MKTIDIHSHSFLDLCIAACGFPGRRTRKADTYNHPKQAGQGVYDPRQKSDMDSLAAPDEVAALAAAVKQDAILFVEDREHSIRWTKAPPRRWLKDMALHTEVFHGTAQPGEFYVFQIGAFAAKRNLKHIQIEFSDLIGQNGAIKSTGLRCFNLGGIDHLGQPFHKSVDVDGHLSFMPCGSALIFPKMRTDFTAE